MGQTKVYMHMYGHQIALSVCIHWWKFHIFMWIICLQICIKCKSFGVFRPQIFFNYIFDFFMIYGDAALFVDSALRRKNNGTTNCYYN